MIYLQLFLSFLKIGFFGFGGGYAMLSLIQNELMVQRGWITATQFTDMVAVSQMTPGPIAINSATWTGYLVTGNVWGSILATVAVCIPPLTLMVVITVCYAKLQKNRYVEGIVGWLRPLTTGMIGASALMFLNRQTFGDWSSAIIFMVVFAAVYLGADAILMLALSALAGIIIY